MFEKSHSLFEKSKKLFPGGVNSPVRAFKSVKSSPVFFKSASGAYLYDVDGNEYIDYIGSWGPMICGHTHPEVVKAVQEVTAKGLSYGACTEWEIELGEMVIDLVPSLEIVRFVTSGTEACMAAIRLARAYTNRPKIIKFAGCYHGHYDSFLVQAGSGVATLGLPDSPGVLNELASQTLTLEYNNLEQVQEAFLKNPDSIAAIIVEPVVGNAGCILPEPGYLQGLRDLCTKYGALLIFDEVMTGFRLSSGGAQKLFNVSPDLTTLGKIIGGGLPVGAYGGKTEIMRMVAPDGPMYQAGTLAGSPLGMVAGATTLRLIQQPGFYANLEKKGAALEEGIKRIAKENNIPIVLNRCGAMFSVFFSEAERIIDYAGAKTSDLERFTKFFKILLEKGIYFPPSQFEACFFSSAHSEKEVQKTLDVIDEAFSEL